MKQMPLDENDTSLDPYQNGQSDAEKLMRRHLQTPGDVITDEELKNLRTSVNAPLENETANFEQEDLEKDKNNDEQIVPWDVID